MGYGYTMNASLVEQDGVWDMGLRIEDTKGINLDYTTSGENLTEMLEDAVSDVLEELYLQYEEEQPEESVEELNNDDYIAQLEKTIEELTEENNSLKIDNKILQKRADKTVNDKMNHSSSDEDLYNYFFKFFRL